MGGNTHPWDQPTVKSWHTALHRLPPPSTAFHRLPPPSTALHRLRTPSTARFLTRNAQRSACSSMILLVGLPAPCPALVSIWMSTGLAQPCAACRAAVNLNECPGTTRSSWSAVVTRVAG